MKQPTSICVAGLGIIGSIWSRHYRTDGFDVRAWNRTPRTESPDFVSDLSRAVRGADVLHICVADPTAVQMVLNEALPNLKQGALVIQSSTISPAAARGFETQTRDAGCAYVEAPFTGSKPAAESRQQVFFLGGENDAVDRAIPFLEKLSRQQFRFENTEQAAAIKLAMNLQIAAISQALTEGFHLAGSYGISGQLFFEVLRHNVGFSGLAELKEPKLLARDYAPQFSVKHMAKDLGLALAAARELRLPQTERTREIYLEGLAANLGDLDFIALESLIAE